MGAARKKILPLIRAGGLALLWAANTATAASKLLNNCEGFAKKIFHEN